MEPLSIGASVVGLLAATAQISKLLTTLVHSGKNAPSLAKHVLREVSDIDAVLTQLRGFLDGSGSGSQYRKKLVMMDQVVVTLANCVMTFSELKTILELLNLDQPTQFRARVGWVRQEHRIQELLEQLQWSKASLNLMLTTLTCVSVDQATESVATLSREIQHILQSNRELSSRLSMLEDTSDRQKLPYFSSLSRQDDHGDDASTIVPIRRASVHQETTDEITSINFAFDFDKDLYDSWVYSRALRRNRPQSLSSSAQNSFAWSCLSDLSLADISNISLMSLPIMGNGQKNPEPYGFKNQIAEPTALLSHGQLDSRGSNIRFETTFPVNVLLLGVPTSGKTTICKQLQILHGNGFRELDRKTYRPVIKHFWMDAVLAIQIVEEEQSNRQTAITNSLLSTGEAHNDLSHFGFCHQIGPGLGFQSCSRCCQNLATDPRIPRHLLTIGNVPYFAARLDEISSDGYIPSESDIIHASISSTGSSSAVFEIDSIRYRFTDAEHQYPLQIPLTPMPELLESSDYVIYSASLIDYRPLAANDRRLMSHSMLQFEDLCKIMDAPIVLLFTKLDLLYLTMAKYPICDYYRDASRDMTCSQACNFFVDHFQARDRRLNGELHIYFVNATDTQDLGQILRDVRENVFSSLLRSPEFRRVYRRQNPTGILSSPRNMKPWELDGGSSPTDTSMMSPLIAESLHTAFSIRSLEKDSSEQESLSRTASKNTETEQSTGDVEVDSGSSSTDTSAISSIIAESPHKAYRVHDSSQQSKDASMHTNGNSDTSANASVKGSKSPIATSPYVPNLVVKSYLDQRANPLKTLPSSRTRTPI